MKVFHVTPPQGAQRLPANTRMGRATRRDMAGFTLLELMVVLAIIALASSGVALALRDSTASDLERDGQRLAAVLESARAQSRMLGTPVLWHAVPGGFRLDGLNPPMPPQHWLSANTTVYAVLRNPPLAPGNAEALAPLTLGPEPIVQAQAVVLAARNQSSARLQLATDGLRPFAIVPMGSPVGAPASAGVP